jgi:hypothetical protein
MSSFEDNNNSYLLNEYLDIESKCVDVKYNNEYDKIEIPNENNSTAFYTGKKRKMEEQKEKIFGFEKKKKRGRKRVKGNHAVHDIFYLDNIIKGIKSFLLTFIINIFNSNLEEAKINLNKCKQKKLLKLAPKEIKKTKKEDNLAFFNKKLKDILSNEESKKYKKTNIIILKESDEENNVEVMTSNKIFIDDNLYQLAEEGNEDVKRFINFLNLTFYDFWSIITSYIKLDNEENLKQNDNICDIFYNDVKENNNIILSIANNINDGIDNYFNKKVKRVKNDYKIIFKCVLKDLYFLINQKKGEFVDNKQ